MTLYEKVVALYPELATYDFADGDIHLADIGNGEFIAKWEHPTLPRPTEEQLA